MCRKKSTNTSTQESPEETQTYTPTPRANGWYCPWNLYMVSVWFFILLFSIFYFGTLLPYLPQIPRYIFYGVGVCVFITVIVSDVIAISINPGDANITAGNGRNKVRPVFDRTKHKHVIENLYCNLCQSEVGYKTKHCKCCDKCVADFDHHCKWLNNCVGERNYWAFFVCVTAGLFGTLLCLIGSLSLFILFFASRANLKWWDGTLPCCNQTNTTVCVQLFQTEIPHPVFPVLMALEFILSIIGICLLGHLFLFHVYLRIIGMSTFDYITRKDEVKHKKLAQRHSNNSRSSTPNNRSQSRTSGHSVKDMKVVRQNSQASDISIHSNGLDTHPRTPELCITPAHMYTHEYAIHMDEYIATPQQPIGEIEMQIIPDFDQSDEGVDDTDITNIIVTDSGQSKSKKQEIIFNTSL
ncbi:palmitoyltransferase ZDHHC11-like [Oopsacas minuta]|uniref:Palmitoyltransferase n=1 Tax=Oopsacas minuta TaxID=111878 RepID=A0AAV7JL30_9METZ|nr:palmitoyltransferase ZDHHC11-like [Oopsacas minuta]